MDYELRSVVACVDAAEAAEALVHDDVPGNLAAELADVIGDPQGAFASVAHVISRRIWVERGAAMPIEGRGVIADDDPDTGELTV